MAELDLPSVERTIYSHEYRATRLTLGDWIELEALVIRILGTQVLDINEENLSALAPMALRGADPSVHKKVFELAAKSLAYRDGDGWRPLTMAIQNRWWARHLQEMPGAIGLFLEVQFKDFFSGLEQLSMHSRDSQEASEASEAQQEIRGLGVFQSG